MLKQKWFLYVGDMIAIAIVTAIGFASHEELGVSFLPRMAAAFFPLVISWFLIAPWFDLFGQTTSRSLWRSVLAMIFAAPLAATFRGLILGAAIAPIFVLVLGATSAFGMFVWRGIYLLLIRKAK